jgi:hypothetical protein
MALDGNSNSGSESHFLPTITVSEIEYRNNDAKSCLVSLREKVCDVTSFLSDHPGGEDLILEYILPRPSFSCLNQTNSWRFLIN